jgi:hypothetical protein
MTTKYRLSTAYVVLLFLLPFIITLGLAVSIWQRVPLALSILGIALTVIAWYSYMTVPIEFEFTPGDRLCFRSVGRRLTFPVHDICQIDARLWNRGFVTIRYSHGSVFLFRKMAGVKDLIERVKSQNPTAVVKGSM